MNLLLTSMKLVCATLPPTIIVFVALRATSSSQTSPPPQPNPLPSAPPAELWQGGAPTTKFGTSIYRDVQCRTLEKIVSLEWRYATPGLPSASNVKDQTSEVYATRYWPTFVLPTDDHHLCVAGKARDGATILESWTFDAQSASGTPAPSCVSFTSTTTGAPHYVWTTPPRSQVDEVLRIPAASPLGMIRALVPDLHSISKVYVYYDGSRELWSVDLIAHTQALVASPVPVAGAMTATALTSSFQLYWAADYTQRGHCYFFAATELPVSGPMAATFVCIDSNRDGALDTSRTISATEWVQEGWGDPANLAQPHD